MFSKSFFVAIGLTVGLALWMLSGYWTNASGRQLPAETASAQLPEPTRVQVRSQQARPVTREIVIQGQVEANRSVTLRAETGGQVKELFAERGRLVEAGDAIVRLDMGDRQARLKKAEALVNQRERDYQALQKLAKTGYQSQTKINQALADREAARADLEAIKRDIADTVIYAPFGGIFNERMVEIGDLAVAGEQIGTVVDTDPLIVTAQVPQQHIGNIGTGDAGSVRLVTGRQAEGRIRYVSTVADSATRTFRVELEIANPDNTIPVGISGELRIPLETVATHFLSPAQLVLDSKGTLGVKLVNDAERVEFHPVAIVRAGAEGIWVSGLPEQARLITVGQGFVQAGEQVTAVAEDRAVALELSTMIVN